VERAIGTDFSPVLIEAAKHEARNYLLDNEQRRVEFCLAKNESLIDDLAKATGVQKTELTNSFHFILGVNTIRYCHRSNKELDCAQEISKLLVPGGVCVVIDMNNQFPIFRSSMKNLFRKQKQEECYLPTLDDYTEPFRKAGFAVWRSEHFCWVPHSSGYIMCRLLVALSPILNSIVKSRAMRSLVVSQKLATGNG
jgi:SAM-dependent methyltransferase